MTDCYVRFIKRAQLKMQQMAFVLVAFVLFFAILGMVFFSFYSSNLKKRAEILRQEEAYQIANSIASSPEFIYSSEDCSNCIDLDKVLMLKEKNYANFLNINSLWIEIVYPEPSNPDLECTKFNYPNCGRITLIGKQSQKTADATNYITLILWTNENGGYMKRYLGKIHASYKQINA